MAFLIRPLNTSSIGSSLRSLRKKQGISLQDVVRKTHIQLAYITAFETGAYQELPDPLYARHLLKQYVEAIYGDVDYYLSRYDEECGSCSAVTDQLRIPRQRTNRLLLQRWRSWMKLFAMVSLVALLLLYIGVQLHSLAAPPNLLIDAPLDGLQTTVASLTVSGQTDKEVHVRVNDRPVLTDPTGRFATQITLTRGMNVITIEARRKYGNAQLVRRSVFLEELSSNRLERTQPRSPFVPHVDEEG